MITLSTTVIASSGRAIFSIFFLLSGLAKITRNKTMVEYAASKKVPFPHLGIALAMVVELVGGISILTGFYSYISACILIVYLIPVSFVFHNFRTAVGPEKQNQTVHFMKNTAIIGGRIILSLVR